MGCDLRGGQRDPGECRAHLPDGALGADERGGHRLALGAGDQRLRELEPCGPPLEPAGGEVQAGLRVARGGRLGDRAAGLDLVVDDVLDRLIRAWLVPARLEIEVPLDGPLDRR